MRTLLAHRLPNGAFRSLVVVLLLGACAPSTPDSRAELPSEPPYLRGVVTAIHEMEIRVEEDPAQPSGSAKAVLRLTPETRILWRSGDRAEAGDLRLGSRVSAWVTGPVMESYPVQGTAATLVIESTTEPALPHV